LQLALDIALSSGFPVAPRWGPEFVLIYDDAYKPILGEKHPWALGLPASLGWSEVWREIEPIHRKILHGKAARSLPRTFCCGSSAIRTSGMTPDSP
jgi:hypothetical protein